MKIKTFCLPKDIISKVKIQSRGKRIVKGLTVNMKNYYNKTNNPIES